jgi:translation initiation factor eIF-2B subunit delta
MDRTAVTASLEIWTVTSTNMDATQETKRGHVNGVLPTPQLTKAQRRELQKTARASAIVSTSTLPSKPKKQQSILQPSKSSTVVGVSTTKDVHSVTSNDADSVLRNLRIFSHFAPPSKPVNSKTEIHPAVLRLASQFAEFRIVGANARCIATVNVLKAVCKHHMLLDYNGR